MGVGSSEFAWRGGGELWRLKGSLEPGPVMVVLVCVCLGQGMEATSSKRDKCGHRGARGRDGDDGERH